VVRLKIASKGHVAFQIIFCISSGNPLVARQNAILSASLGHNRRPLVRRLFAIRPSFRGAGGGDCTASELVVKSIADHTLRNP